MIYSDGDIKELLAGGDIDIDAVRAEAIQPASVDLHLSDRPLKVWLRSDEPIVPWQDQSHEMFKLPFVDGCVALRPGDFALASTVERVKIGPLVAGRLEGKSSLARLGLIVHTTAGFFDPGFEGYPTLELLNVSPRSILLRPDMPIAQMAFFSMSAAAEVSYAERGNYANQGADPAASRYFRNFESPAPAPSDTKPEPMCEWCGHGGPCCRSDSGFLCSRPIGHDGDHVACSVIDHRIDVWPRAGYAADIEAGYRHRIWPAGSTPGGES